MLIYTVMEFELFVQFGQARLSTNVCEDGQDSVLAILQNTNGNSSDSTGKIWETLPFHDCTK